MSARIAQLVLAEAAERGAEPGAVADVLVGLGERTTVVPKARDGR